MKTTCPIIFRKVTCDASSAPRSRVPELPVESSRCGMTKKSTPTRVHITPDKDGGWNAVPANRRPIGNFPTQREAQDVGRDYLQNRDGGELTTHRRNNLIRESDTIDPAKDPFPPRG